MSRRIPTRYRTTARTRQALRLCIEALMLAGHGPAACRVDEWQKIERKFIQRRNDQAIKEQ